MIFKKKPTPLADLFSNDFIDIHNHLLPGIDDGAKNMKDSIALIKKMASLGINNFIITPHVLGEVYPNSSKTILTKLEEVRDTLRNNGMQDINIRAAAEYMMDEQFSIRLAANDILTLKDEYILVEMSYFNAPLNLFDIIFDIQLKGYKPILAHPERYNFYHSDIDNYYKLKKAGCLFQLNALSLTDHYGKGVKKTSESLLGAGMYDFIGSDTHHENHLRLLESIKLPSKLKNIVEKLCQNNVSVLT